MLTIEKREPAIGKPRETQRYELLEAIEVENQVDWVNENLRTPLKFKVGEKAKVGVFLVPEVPKDKTIRDNIREFYERIIKARSGSKSFKTKVEIKKGHRRSGLLTRAVFEDNDGHQYRDIDIKGLGYSEVVYAYSSLEGEIIRVATLPLKIFGPEWAGQGFEVHGLLNYLAARHDMEMGEAFHKAGIRTERTIAILKLREVIDEDGKAVKLEEARKRGLISGRLMPALAVRAYGTKARVFKEAGPKEREDEIEDAKTLVAQEIGLDPKSFPTPDYLKWFAETLGGNIGLMHKNGWFHSYLENGNVPKNITLDCRITDRDSVGFLRNLSEKQKREYLSKDKNDGAFIVQELSLMAEPTLRKEQRQKGEIYDSDSDFYFSFLIPLQAVLRQEYLSHYDKSLGSSDY
jgi:hypothetical protein